MDDFISKLINSKDEELESLVNSRISSLLLERVGQNHLNIKPYASGPVAYRCALNDTNTQLFALYALDSLYAYFFDITKEICESLTIKIKHNSPKNFDDVSKIIAETTFEYVGGPEVLGTIKDRLSHLKEWDSLKNNDKNHISAFKESQNAWCTERASIAHQLFKFLGYEAELVISPIIVDGKKENHAFNLIKLNNKVVLFDATMLDYSKDDPSKSCIVFDNLPLSCYDKVVDIPERVFKSKTNQERHCQINPKNLSTVICGVIEKERT